MRKGFNPQKDKKEEGNKFTHQVIVPVFIPCNEGYFKNSFAILKYCLTSLFKTSHNNTFFTIVNNGSHKQVASYLENLRAENKIQELIHTNNIGKVNAVYKGITGHSFPLITIADADVLFLNDWQKTTYAIFKEFPKTGFVSLSPNPKLLKYNTYDIIINFLLSKKMVFTKPKDPEALKQFAHSIENVKFYKNCHINNVLTIQGRSINAVVGGGHFVATYRGAIFKGLKNRYSNFKLGGKSVRVFMDQPVVDKNYWRLSTEDNFAYHMGNVEETWMPETVKNLFLNENASINIPELKRIRRNKFFMNFKKVIVEKILFKKPIWNWFLTFKGLSKENSNNY